MKKSLLVLSMLTLMVWSINAKAQSVNDTVFWNGGWCTVCGNPYSCSQGAFDVTWNGGNQTFFDPLPIGATLTGISVAVCEADCGSTNVTVSINSDTIGSYSPAASCSCYGSLIYIVSGMIANYNYQGNNTINLNPYPNTLNPLKCICVSNAVITLVYNTGTVIVVNQINPLEYCPGGSISIPYIAVGVFHNDNIFTAQLSDSSGSFASPDTLGTLNSTTSGTISGIIPLDAITGNHYRIRVNSSDTAFIGNDNGVNISIGEPIPVITPSDSMTVCGGGVLTSSQAFSYLWSNGATTQSINVTTSGSFTVTTSNSAGCSATSIPTVVTVNTAPTVTISANGPTSFCIGGSVTLDAGVYSSYLWNNGSTSETKYVTSSGTYRVTVTDINGCTGSASQTVSIDTLIANAGNNINIGCGNSTALNVTTNVQGPFTYNWSPSTGLNNPSIQSPIATLYNPTTYTVSVTDSLCSATATVSVNIVPLTAIGICIVSVDSATNKNMVIWNQPLGTPVDSFYIYRETNQSGIYAQIGSQAASAFSTFIDTGSYPEVQANRYEIGFLDSCGLVSDTSTHHKTIHLSINQGLGNTYNLIWDAYEGFSFLSYNIYRGTALSNIALLTTIASNLYQYTDLNPPLGTVYYAIEVADSQNCAPSTYRMEFNNYNISMSNITNSSASGINSIQGSNNISIYPNPATSKLTFLSQYPILSSQLLITDVIGKEVYSQPIINSTQTSIDISDWSNGVYFYQIKNVPNESGETVRGKFVVEK